MEGACCGEANLSPRSQPVGRRPFHRANARSPFPASRGRIKGPLRSLLLRGAGYESVMRAPRQTVANAQRLRRALSAPEAQLWSRLRKRAPGKPVFRRQHPIGPYVLDFYCAKARLAIELDGASHDMGDRPQRDMRRDAWLKARGVTVLRIAANDLMRGFDETADAIVSMAADLL